jgi:hypothetical protein
LEKVQKAHEDDLSLIENLREKHERPAKTAEGLRINNASLAKSLSTKDRKILDLEKALAKQDETSKRNASEILEKLKLLYEEYKKSLNEFGVRPAPLTANIKIPKFMDWIETEFKALSKVISGASDFAAAFSVESILKILHDFDCADLEKFRDKISQFPSATSTSIIRANADVQAIKNKFAREFWFASGKETVKVIARAKLAEVIFCTISSLVPAIDVSVFRVPFTFSFLSFSAERGRRSREYCCVPRRVNFRAKILATQAKGVRAAAAVAAMRAASTGKLLGVMKVLRRWTSWIRFLSKPCTPSRLSVYFVDSLSFSEQMFCKL